MSGFGSSLGGYSEFQATGITKLGPKSKPKKILRASNKTQKNPWTKNKPPPKSHAKFLSLQNLQKGKLVWFYFNWRTAWPGYTAIRPYGPGPPKKILDKLNYPKNSRNQKFPPPKKASVILITWNLEYPPPPTPAPIIQSDMRQFLRISKESGPWLRKFYWHIKKKNIQRDQNDLDLQQKIVIYWSGNQFF